MCEVHLHVRVRVCVFTMECAFKFASASLKIILTRKLNLRRQRIVLILSNLIILREEILYLNIM